MIDYKCNDCGKITSIDDLDHVQGALSFPKKIWKCQHCQSTNLEYLEPEEDNQLRLNVGAYSGLSREQKVSVLKKRSRDHFKKEVKEKRKFMFSTNSDNPSKTS